MICPDGKIDLGDCGLNFPYDNDSPPLRPPPSFQNVVVDCMIPNGAPFLGQNPSSANTYLHRWVLVGLVTRKRPVVTSPMGFVKGRVIGRLFCAPSLCWAWCDWSIGYYQHWRHSWQFILGGYHPGVQILYNMIWPGGRWGFCWWANTRLLPQADLEWCSYLGQIVWNATSGNFDQSLLDAFRY